MKRFLRAHWGTVIIIVLLLIIIILLFFKCCFCGKHMPTAKAYQNQLIIWKKPGSPDDVFKTWLELFKDKVRQSGEITDSAVCPSCDSSLLKLSGPGPLIYIEQELATGSGGTPTGGVGNEGPAYYCSNLDLNVPELVNLRVRSANDSLRGDSSYRDSLPGFYNYPKKPAPSGTATVTVAVFDTGIDTALRNNYVLKNPQTCIIDTLSRYGWNFVANSSNTKDDNPGQHGSVVTKFILEQVQLYNPGSVNIIPVKVLDSTGSGNLYNLLCGIAYAAKAGAKVFNASLGFYYYPDTPLKQSADSLLRKYLHYYLTKNNIIMIAAAGNRDPHEDSLYKVQNGNPAANPRNLDSNPFFPASLAGTSDSTFNNVFTVTTVSFDSSRVSPLQNFSGDIVDIGVNCDTVLNDTLPNGAIVEEYVFGNTIFKLQKADSILTVTGSSFATPIITGRIAANYNILVTGNPVNKKSIISNMSKGPARGQPQNPPNRSNHHRPNNPPDPMVFPKNAFNGLIRDGITAYRF